MRMGKSGEGWGRRKLSGHWWLNEKGYSTTVAEDHADYSGKLRRRLDIEVLGITA